MKKPAIRYGVTYLIIWGILGIVLLQNRSDANANLTQAGLLKGIVMFHLAMAMTAAMEALARAVWSRMRNHWRCQRREDSNG